MAGAPVFLEVLRARNVKKSDLTSESDPYVSVTLHETGSATSAVVPGSVEAKWPVVDNDKHPCWFSTSWISPCGTPGNGLLVKLWDEDPGGRFNKDDFLGEICVPLQSLPDGVVKEVSICPPKDPKHVQTIELRVRRSFPAPQKRVVLIRHGESEWNDAQSNKKFKVMLERVDHPLTNTGVSQALGLAEQIAAAAKDGVDDKYVQDLLQAPVVYSSPLCRAVQTAMLACAPLAANPKLSWELKKNAREKRNRGGRDSSGSHYGAKIVKYLHTELDELAERWQEEGKGPPLPDALHELVDRLDYKETETQWWQDDAEDKDDAAFRARQLFFHQIMWDPRDVVVLVGHSHFFRDFFATYFSPRFAAKVAGGGTRYSAEDWASKKLNNCGVAHVSLDFTPVHDAWRSGRAPADAEYKCIEHVELLFDTRLIK